MNDFASELFSIPIEEELKQSYLDYAMSVIVGRALPDARDGLKPVHRRVLYAMHELNNDWNKPYKKSARVVGDVIGKYHPHGEVAVYDAVVRMTQPFSMRYPLIDGQGNFGSVDGDAPAAMRYTEVRMAKLAHMLLADIDKETVDFVPNYDETEMAPAVLPTKVPNLLINGSSGIAVGMATNIPPHNLNEIIDALIAVIDNPAISFEELLQIVPGPDFPTAGIISGKDGIVSAYKTGRGRIYVRARTHVETDEKSGKEKLIVTQLPYQVNKARLIERIAELVKLKKVEGISELRDESDKDGMRIVIEIKRGESAEIIENNLLSHTQLQNVFGINIVALIDSRPRVLTLRELLQEFIRHRRTVVTRRSIYLLRKARERAHILEGLGIALANIEAMIALIKKAANPKAAKEQLLAQSWPLGMVAKMLERADDDICRPEGLPSEYGMHEQNYRLTAEQAQAILDLRLHRLTGLEQEKILNEYQSLREQIKELLQILSSPEKLLTIIKQELQEIKQEFGNERRTEIIANHSDLQIEDLISDETMVVTVSHQGYTKTQPLDIYTAQRRGGRGKSATQVKEEDFVEHLLVANTHDTILCFSNVGKAYWLKVYALPQASRASRGKPIVNLLPLAKEEKITSILPLRDFKTDQYVLMATQKGTVKKVHIKDFSRPRSSGIIAINLEAGDHLIGSALTDGHDDVMLFSDTGKVIRFNEANVRACGRTAKGVRGIKIKSDQNVISLVIAKPEGAILTATENGYGKRTEISDYRTSGRGGQGVISIQVSQRNGLVVGATQVNEDDEVMLITNKGTVVRTNVKEISLVGRNTQGVRLINLAGEEKLVSIARINEMNQVEESVEQEN
ncbi:MAG: DNA gyrase subunit A [Pseudomonadota bacterium]